MYIHGTKIHAKCDVVGHPPWGVFHHIETEPNVPNHYMHSFSRHNILLSNSEYCVIVIIKILQTWWCNHTRQMWLMMQWCGMNHNILSRDLLITSGTDCQRPVLYNCDEWWASGWLECHRTYDYSISQEICTRFLLCCALWWLNIDWFAHIHQAYFTGTVAI